MATNDSQVDDTDAVKSFSADLQGSGLEFLKNAVEKIHTSLKFRPIQTDADNQTETAIRWRRTADQIIHDGYVYAGRSCTDEVVTFIALCHAKGLETRFVKLNYLTPEGTYTHSVAEVRLPDDWYMIDVNGDWGIRKGAISSDEHINGYRVWKKGRDAWDLGLVDFGSQTKLTQA